MIKSKIFNSKKRKKILLISLISLFCLAFLGGIFLLGRYHKREDARVRSPKFLAELIKADLAEEREKIKSGQKVKLSKYDLWYEENDEKDTEIYCSSDHFKNKTYGRWLVKQADLEKK